MPYKMWVITSEAGLRVALFTRTYARIVRPGLSQVMPEAPAGGDSTLRRQFDQLEVAMDKWVERAKLAA